ncbi:MAG: hypothetical protein E7321_08735 [Clostridiales bacterium]|nr:hypothetical protein [Clostridiales bacterium]
MMKKRAMALLLCAMAFLFAAGALAQGATYVFPYEGFRYTQKESETVLTQTNLHEHEDLIAALGTTQDAILASYMASGIVMEVIPQEGGQIAVSVADAGAFSDVKWMSEIGEERLAAFKALFEESGLYETVELTDTVPVCVRLTSSAMYASMPVYSLRYAMLHLGRLYMITQTIVGRAPESADDARMAQVLSGMKLLSTVSDPTPAPTPVPTPTPEPTPVPTPGVAEVIASSGVMEVSGVPSYTNDPRITITGVTDPSAEVRVAVDEKTLGSATAKRDGSFTLKVTLPEEGEQTLAVMTDAAEAMLAITYEMPMARLNVTLPENSVFSGDHVMVRGKTEPDATIYISGKSMNTNVKANKNGDFSIRVSIEGEGTETFELRTKVKGYQENRTQITLTREFTLREGIAEFRKKLQPVEYADLLKDPAKHEGRQFMLRGRVEAFADFDGRASALVCVENVAVGEWKDPVWVVLSGDEDLAQGNIATFYLIGTGLTLPADGAYTRDGADVEAPVAEAKYVAEISEGK